MTIDERLERLTERHEALAQSLELLASMMAESDKRTEGRMERLIEAMTRLTAVVESHEHRLDRLEGNQ